jgi:hypothetical protein
MNRGSSPQRKAVGLELVSRGPLFTYLADPKRTRSCRPVKSRMYTSVDIDVELEARRRERTAGHYTLHGRDKTPLRVQKCFWGSSFLQGGLAVVCSDSEIRM